MQPVVKKIRCPNLEANYEQVNLVGDDGANSPARIDPNLRNAWGIAFAPTGPAWVNAEVTGLSAIYNTQGADVRPPVAIPSPASKEGGGHPTGIVFNKSSGFKLPNGNPARFIFVGDDGTISAWNGGNVAIKLGDHTAAYTGLAIAADGADSFIYAANFLPPTSMFMIRAGKKYPANLSQTLFCPRGIRHLIFKI